MMTNASWQEYEYVKAALTLFEYVYKQYRHVTTHDLSRVITHTGIIIPKSMT